MKASGSIAWVIITAIYSTFGTVACDQRKQDLNGIQMETHTVQFTLPPYVSIDMDVNDDFSKAGFDETKEKWRSDLAWNGVPTPESRVEISHHEQDNKVIIEGFGRDLLDAEIIAKVAEFTLLDYWLSQAKSKLYSKEAEPAAGAHLDLVRHGFALRSAISNYQYELACRIEGKPLSPSEKAFSEGLSRQIAKIAEDMYPKMRAESLQIVHSEKEREEVKLPKELIEWFGEAAELIRESYDLIVTDSPFAYGASHPDGSYKFGYYPELASQGTAIKWEMSLKKDEALAIANKELKSITLWKCRKEDCLNRFANERGYCPTCDRASVFNE